MLTPLEGFFFHDFKNSYIANILREIYLDRVYEPFLLGKSDQVIVDVGANIGLTSYYFKDYAARVFAMEPSRLHLEALTRMVEFNQIKNIQIIPFALSSVNAPSYFFHNQNKTMYSLDSRLASVPDETEVVMSISLDTLFGFCKIDHIDFLKLDPEGAESDIIQSESFKTYAPKIKTIVGELHAWASLDKESFQKKLEELGYKFNWISEKDAQLYSAEYGK